MTSISAHEIENIFEHVFWILNDLVMELDQLIDIVTQRQYFHIFYIFAFYSFLCFLYFLFYFAVFFARVLSVAVVDTCDQYRPYCVRHTGKLLYLGFEILFM